MKQIKILLNVADKIRINVQPLYRVAERLDDIAKEWEMTVGINQFLDDILFYQTRHYKHSE